MDEITSTFNAFFDMHLDALELSTILLCLASVFSLINLSLLKLPQTIGLMVLALALSLSILVLGFIYPKIFNVVLSKKISSLLELDPENPYVEIMEVKRNKTFIAKKTNTFEEERNVADTVSIGEIEMDDLTKSESISKKKSNKKHKFT